MSSPKGGLLLAKLNMKGEEAGEDAESPDDEAGEEAAGEELAAAIKSGDGKAVADAFSALMAVCK